MAKEDKYPVDFIIPWVDGSDPEWRAEKRLYAEKEGVPSVIDDSETRFRDWDTLKYLFRSIEKYTPWVNRIHFITWGHLPKWMNPEAPGLHIVRHVDYMDPAYLPTFSSHTIELNLHRIKGLAEHFVYFNDDILLLSKMGRDYFFKNGLPRDYAIFNVISSSHRGSVMDTALTDIEVINDHFKKNAVLRKNFRKWFNPVYGKDIYRTFSLMPWPIFINLYGTHTSNAYLKSTFEKVWEEEYDLLNSTCLHKFRTRRDANQWLMREWQLCEGNFIPTSPKRGRLMSIKNDNSHIYNAIKNKKYKEICINDNGAEQILDFDKTYHELVSFLEEEFPEKSRFER